jgi:anti-sigma regulatory factor (Ser/Thr protein kinase)
VHVTSVDLRFPSKSVYVGVARLAVAGIARVSGFDEDTVFDLKTAVSEAFATAVIHTEKGGESPIRLSWEESPEWVVIEIRHEGSLRDPTSTDVGGSERQEMSIALLRSLLHDCEFVAEEDGSTTIRLSLRR